MTKVAACLGWLALAIQLYLVLEARWAAQASLLGGLISFFSYFTVLSNTLVAVVLSYAAFGRDSSVRRLFLSPWLSSGIAASIALVALAYSLLLRHLWQPQGWQWLADELLHDVMPVLYLLYWWRCVPKGGLRPGHLLLWLIYPLLYFGYALWRGESIGVYQYPFINVADLGYTQVLLNALAILLGFVLIAALLIGIDRWLGKRQAQGQALR